MRHMRRKNNKTKKRGGKLGSCQNSNKYNISNRLPVNSSTGVLYYNMKNPNIIIKTVGPSEWLNDDRIKDELEASKLASDLYLGPKVHYSCFDDKNKIGYIVMDKIYGVTVDKILDMVNNSKKNEISAIAKELFTQLYVNGIYHRDTHPGNFMWGTTQSEPRERMWIIDFGNIETVNESNITNIPPFTLD